jgi:hypothetical protein
VRGHLAAARVLRTDCGPEQGLGVPAGPHQVSSVLLFCHSPFYSEHCVAFSFTNLRKLVTSHINQACSIVRPPLWSSGQSSWLQIRRPGFDSRHYQKKVVGLERGPLSLVSTTEELLGRKVAAPV